MAGWDELKVKTGELLEEGLRTGALTEAEWRWRCDHLDRAQSVDELEGLVRDLLDPAPASATVSVAPGSRSSQTTLLSNRNFALEALGARSEVVTLLGSSRVDLRSHRPGDALHLELVTLLGETVVEVAPGARVKVEGTPVLGDVFVAPSVVSSTPDIRITGVIILGSLRVVEAKRL